jgi:sn-glycerol 3-phosphate transport system substrate-binding protein
MLQSGVYIYVFHGASIMKKNLMAVLLCAAAVNALAQDVTLRSALSGPRLDTLNALVARFNAVQKGRDSVRLQDVKAVDDLRQLPGMALLNIEDSQAMFHSRPKFKPLYQVMKESGQKLDSAGIYPPVAETMSEKPGQLQALPLGLSLPVLFWNKDIFHKAGLEPDAVPRTWHDVLVAAGKLNDAGVACPLTSSRFTWVHMENVSTQQGQPIFATIKRVALNGLINIKHVAMLASWYRSNYFRYYGAHAEADAHFLSGDCAMLTGESALYGDIQTQAKVKAGVGSLPYYEDEYGATPGNVSLDGAGLWMLAGRKKEEYKVMARFAAFMVRPENQREWVKGTGYLPMTSLAMPALRESNVPPVVVDAAVRRLAMRPDKKELKNSSLLTRMRDNVDQQIELVWNDKVSVKAALDAAMSHTNSAVATAPKK